MFELFRDWFRRRARFSEEWTFRRDRLSAELKAMGLPERDVRRLVSRRMGARSRWRRDALRETGGDWRGFFALLNAGRFARMPWVLPASLVLLLLLFFVFNPLRDQLLKSLTGEAHGYLPMRRLILIPVDFSRLTWGAIVLFQIAWLWNSKAGWRITAYAVLLSGLLGAVAMTVWVTALQILIALRWPSDMLQGCCLTGFVFTYAWASLFAARCWRRDVAHRCPVCLELLRFPIQRGRGFDVLIDPPETELMCRRGHGLLTENHWQRTFRASSGFWQDLARS